MAHSRVSCFRRDEPPAAFLRRSARWPTPFSSRHTVHYRHYIGDASITLQLRRLRHGPVACNGEEAYHHRTIISRRRSASFQRVAKVRFSRLLHALRHHRAAFIAWHGSRRRPAHASRCRRAYAEVISSRAAPARSCRRHLWRRRHAHDDCRGSAAHFTGSVAHYCRQPAALALITAGASAGRRSAWRSDAAHRANTSRQRRARGSGFSLAAT